MTHVLTPAHAHTLTTQYGSPLYIYDKAGLSGRAKQLAMLSSPFGLTTRYAMKANPHPDIINLFHDQGLHFDASSSYEAANLLAQGIPGSHISLSSQQPAHNLVELLEAGVQYVATSLHQLELFAAVATPDSTVGLRVNTGMGSGHNNRTTTAGTSASFGLWHEYLDQALLRARNHSITITRLHTHLGSGADPKVWQRAIDTSLAIAAQMPDVTSLDMGGGYKVRRAEGEQETDMNEVTAVFNQQLEAFAQKTGRQLQLEIEPGTWLVAHGGCLLTEVVDIVGTGRDGFTFLRTNTGMNDFMRPTLYGAQHAIYALNDSKTTEDYVVVGHNCESGDILTPEVGDSEHIKPQKIKTTKIGDLLLIADTGAYGASLRAKGYNAFPPAAEVLI